MTENGCLFAENLDFTGMVWVRGIIEASLCGFSDTDGCGIYLCGEGPRKAWGAFHKCVIEKCKHADVFMNHGHAWFIDCEIRGNLRGLLMHTEGSAKSNVRRVPWLFVIETVQKHEGAAPCGPPSMSTRRRKSRACSQGAQRNEAEPLKFVETCRGGTLLTSEKS